MRASMAFFAGAGTVLIAVAIGLGGGFVMADIMNPQGTREVSKLAQRHAPPQQAEQSAQPSRSSGVANGSQASGSQASAPYLAATEQAATTPVVISPAASSSTQPRTETNNTPAAPASVPAETKAETTGNAASKPAETSTPAAREQGAAENAYAKAHDADVKHAANEKRKADRAERRRQWAARRQQQREQQQRDSEAQLSEDREPQRNIIVRRDDSWREDFNRPERMDFPRFIFGED